MKICYVYHSTEGDTGIGRLAGSIREYARKTLPFESVTMSGDDVFNLRKKVRFLLNLPKIWRAIRRCNLIHVFDVYPYGFLTVLLGKIAGRPVLLTAVGTGSVRHIHKFPYRFLFAYSFKNAWQVTAISNYIKNKINLVFPDVRAEVINPGLEFEFWSTENPAVANPAAGLGVYLLSVGTFKKRKGLENSLEVFRLLAENRPDLRYVIISSRRPKGEYYEKIKSLIESSGLGDKVVILSELTDEELRAVYHGARLFILLPREDGEDVEGFGLVFLEAAAAGLPVVGAGNSGASDALLDGRNGYLVDGENIGEVKEKCEEILTNRNLSAEFSENSKKFAAAMDWPRTAAGYVEIYRKIAI